ncbi:MAG: SBBP repeat-containing protein [Phycisphaerales bacterium]
MRRSSQGDGSIGLPAFFTLATLAAGSLAHAQQRTWLREFGTFNDDAASAVSVAEGGGCFVAGTTWTLWFPGGVDPADIFLSRFDDAGTLLWGVQFGSSGDDWVYASTPDGSGGVFLAGETGGSFGGPYAGGFDAWFARCDAAGNRLWVKQIGTPGLDRAVAVATDGHDGVFVVGGSAGAGGGGYWLTRYDGSGRAMWFRPLARAASFFALAPDGQGGLFAAGSTTTSFAGPHMGLQDAWIGRFDPDGNMLWARQLGTTAADWAQGLAEDGLGGAFVAGVTYGALAGSNAGEADAWAAHYDGSANQLAFAQFGTLQFDGITCVARDATGGAIVSGVTNGSMGASSAGAADAWVAHLDSGLNISWIDQFGSPVHDQPGAIAFAGPGNAYVCGWTYGDLPGTGGGGGGDDAWLARYDLCYADCNGDGAQTVADFGCFQSKYVLGDPYADCNASGNLTIADFGCFQNKYVLGCP